MFLGHKSKIPMAIKHDIISSFLVLCDGEFESRQYDGLIPSVSSMGVCHLCYDESLHILHVHLTRPAILIGRHGRTIEDLERMLECKIEIHEVILGSKTKLIF